MRGASRTKCILSLFHSIKKRYKIHRSGSYLASTNGKNIPSFLPRNVSIAWTSHLPPLFTNTLGLSSWFPLFLFFWKINKKVSPLTPSSGSFAHHPCQNTHNSFIPLETIFDHLNVGLSSRDGFSLFFMEISCNNLMFFTESVVIFTSFISNPTQKTRPSFLLKMPGLVKSLFFSSSVFIGQAVPNPDEKKNYFPSGLCFPKSMEVAVFLNRKNLFFK